MQSLVDEINALKKTNVKIIIEKRIRDFEDVDKKSNVELFKELCFCILTANFDAGKTIEIQKKLGDCVLTESKDEIADKLKKFGHRFPNIRAVYISKLKKHEDQLVKIVNSLNAEKLREWFVKNVKGLGYKEASHFLRNIGFKDYAIIDYHILDVLTRYNIIKKPKTLTKKKYLETENKLRLLAKKTGLTLAELDLYLWYLETKKVLK